MTTPAFYWGTRSDILLGKIDEMLFKILDSALIIAYEDDICTIQTTKSMQCLDEE